MRIIQSNCISVDGCIARENGQEDWLPSEGWDEFLNDAARFSNFIMGRETYEVVNTLYQNYNFHNVSVLHKIIITTQPGFTAPSDYVVVHSPKEAIMHLMKNGLETGLLIGGGRLNSAFYHYGLVDETWLTITPYTLGQGRRVTNGIPLGVHLQLHDTIELTKGRLQLRYSVIK